MIGYRSGAHWRSYATIDDIRQQGKIKHFHILSIMN